MQPNKVAIENAQFILCYLLIASDGVVNKDEKELFLSVITRVGNFTRSYSESVFNGMHKFAKKLSYRYHIDIIKDASTDQKNKTIELLRELSFADKNYHKEEVAFILKVQKDLKVL